MPADGCGLARKIKICFDGFIDGTAFLHFSALGRGGGGQQRCGRGGLNMGDVLCNLEGESRLG